MCPEYSVTYPDRYFIPAGEAAAVANPNPVNVSAMDITCNLQPSPAFTIKNVGSTRTITLNVDRTFWLSYLPERNLFLRIRTPQNIRSPNGAGVCTFVDGGSYVQQQCSSGFPEETFDFEKRANGCYQIRQRSSTGPAHTSQRRSDASSCRAARARPSQRPTQVSSTSSSSPWPSGVRPSTSSSAGRRPFARPLTSSGPAWWPWRPTGERLAPLGQVRGTPVRWL